MGSDVFFSTRPQSHVFQSCFSVPAILQTAVRWETAILFWLMFGCRNEGFIGASLAKLLLL